LMHRIYLQALIIHLYFFLLVRASIQIENLNAKLKNCFKPVMDYKDISKMVLMMQTVVTQAKPRISALIQKYMNYAYLWKDEREIEIKDFVDSQPVITEVEALMRKYNSIEDEINDLVSSHRIGPLDVHTQEMKLGLTIEVKAFKNLLCKFLSDDYKVKSLMIAKFIEECNKDLQTPIRDMNDIHFVMTVLEKIRDKFVDYDSLLVPIEECYSFLAAQNYKKVTEEEVNRADTLRYNFNKLQTKVRALIHSVELFKNISIIY